MQFSRPCNKAAEADAFGVDVVDATLALIEEIVDVDDFSLMHRLALVESNFGEDSEVMEQNGTGGLWQVIYAFSFSIFNFFCG